MCSSPPTDFSVTSQRPSSSHPMRGGIKAWLGVGQGVKGLRVLHLVSAWLALPFWSPTRRGDRLQSYTHDAPAISLSQRRRILLTFLCANNLNRSGISSSSSFVIYNPL